MWFFNNVFRKKVVAGCGHETFKKDKIAAFGESVEIKIPIIDGKTNYCHRCLEKMSIKCAWCGGVIFISSPITLYISQKKDFKVPKYAIIYDEDPFFASLRFGL